MSVCVCGVADGLITRCMFHAEQNQGLMGLCFVNSLWNNNQVWSFCTDHKVEESSYWG